jgi:hypothetical protein
MGHWPESDLSFSLDEHQPPPQPSIAYFSVQSTEAAKNRLNRTDKDGKNSNEGPGHGGRVGICYIPPVLAGNIDWTRQVKIEQKLIAKKLRGIEVEPDVPWPVSSNVTGYRWFTFRDTAGRFYCFLFLGRLSHTILARFYERLKEVVKEAGDQMAMQTAVRQTVDKFNDFTYRESLSDFIKRDDVPQSIDESKKETCITESEKNRPKKKAVEEKNKTVSREAEQKAVEGKDLSDKFWRRHRRMFVMRLSVAFGISATLFLCVVERFQSIRAERMTIY